MKPDHDAAERNGNTIAGDRGVALVHRERSLQSRINGILALVLTLGLGGCLLAWYYGSMLSRPARAAVRRPAVQSPAARDTVLPPLDPDPVPARLPAVMAITATSIPTGQAGGPPTAAMVAEDLNRSASLAPALMPPPLLPPGAYGARGNYPVQGGIANPGMHQVSPLERRLSGPAFARQSGDASGEGVAPAPGTPAGGFTSAGTPELGPGQALPAGAGSPAGGAGGTLAGLLTPTVLPAVRPGRLASQRYLLPKGAFIDCTLETAIDSSLPGMTTCIAATDTFSADGKVVLLERGSKFIGETRGQVQQGSTRLFVLWTEARAPSGVVVPLDSPGTDELGRAGLMGEVERHFWQRFGAAILVSMIDGAAQSAQRSGNGGTVVLDPASSQEVATEALKGTINIPPTLLKNQGDRIQILVARDLDFRSVYELRARPAD